MSEERQLLIKARPEAALLVPTCAGESSSSRSAAVVRTTMATLILQAVTWVMVSPDVLV